MDENVHICYGSGEKAEGAILSEQTSRRKGKGKRRTASTAIAVCLMVSSLILSAYGPASSLPAENGEAVGSAASLPTENGALETVASQAKEAGAASQAAVEALIGYIDQAQTAIEKANSETGALEETDGVTRSRGQAEISEKLVATLTDIQKQAASVKGLDARLKAAGDEYFNMTYDSQKALLEIRSFFADYLELYSRYLENRPQMQNYPERADYYDALNQWYKTARQVYGDMKTCPPCLEGQWKKYGEILDLNNSIVQKLYQSKRYEDNLRYLSAQYMSDRYVTMEELQYQEFINCLSGESDHFRRQADYSFRLADEIRAYADMEEQERAGYVFANVKTGTITLAYDVTDTIYPSLYNSYNAFAIIKTGCIGGSRRILVEAEIPGFTQHYKEIFTLDSAYKAIYIKPPALPGDLNLTSAKNAQIQITISEQDGTLIDAKTFPIVIKNKYDFEWYTDEYGVSTKDNILCFMTPEAEAISRLKRQAIEEISNMTDGKMQSFVGYQDNPWNNHYVGTYLQAAGIMRALYEMGVRYNMDSFSISGSNQHILFPEDVIALKSGLCIETSLVVASALQSAGMHAFLVFPPGHAQVAVEAWNGTGDGVGTGEYFLIETTALSDDWQEDFVAGMNSLLENKGPRSGPITYHNQDSWYQYLTEENTYLIDCNDSRILGMTPFSN